jgi:hypothetical protein
MDFGTVKGVVYIQGLFQISYPSAEGDEEKMKDLTIKSLYSLEKKVRNIPGVTDVIFQLFNWRKERGQWGPVEVKKKIEEDENWAKSNL